jgi:hypothetical protein
MKMHITFVKGFPTIPKSKLGVPWFGRVRA